jgi:hypothetical protein
MRIMFDGDDPQFETSPLNGEYTKDGVTVRLEIYRLPRWSKGWALEVIHHEGGSTIWDGTFASDRDAYREFRMTLATEGISAFLNDSPGRKH